MQVLSAFSIAVTATALVAAIGLIAPIGVMAQLRPDQPVVIQPLSPPTTVPTPNFVSEFHARYVAAGSPRIMLYWNVELTDRSRAEVVLRDNESKTTSKTVNAQGQAIAGWDSRTTTVKGNAQGQTNRQREGPAWASVRAPSGQTC